MKSEITKEVENRLARIFSETRETKNIDAEHIILNDGKRVSLNGKTVWGSLKKAQAAVKRMEQGKNWLLKDDSVYRYVTRNWNTTAPSEVRTSMKIIRESWIKKHITIVLLKDYIYFNVKMKENSSKE